MLFVQNSTNKSSATMLSSAFIQGEILPIHWGRREGAAADICCTAAAGIPGSGCYMLGIFYNPWLFLQKGKPVTVLLQGTGIFMTALL